MEQFNSPLDSNGFFSLKLCSFSVHDKLGEVGPICGNASNLSKRCRLDNCPILSKDEKMLQASIRNELIHTAPETNNHKVSFPDWYKKGRIEISRGIRMIDWNGEKWEVFIKDGVSWDKDVFCDDDFEILNDSLRIQEKSS